MHPMNIHGEKKMYMNIYEEQNWDWIVIITGSVMNIHGQKNNTIYLWGTKLRLIGHLEQPMQQRAKTKYRLNNKYSLKINIYEEHNLDWIFIITSSIMNIHGKKRTMKMNIYEEQIWDCLGVWIQCILCNKEQWTNARSIMNIHGPNKTWKWIFIKPKIETIKIENNYPWVKYMLKKGVKFDKIAKLLTENKIKTW